MGVETTRGRVFLTGRIRATRTRSAAAGRRQRLAVIAKPRYTEGQVPGRAANSLQFTVTGNAAITRPLAAALTRARCTSKRFAGRGSGPVRAGTQLGRVTVALLPGTAVGLAGQSFLESPGFRLQSEDGTAVGVTPAGGAASTRVAGQSYLRFDLAPGARTPLACEFGTSCVPSGGGFGLSGGITLSLNGHTADVGALAVSYPGPSITGTLNGSPVTITTTGVDFTDDFLARAGAALGATLNGRVQPLVTRFTTTAAG
jgi:hypothetical protein